MNFNSEPSILILPDSFKNCLSSIEVANALAKGIRRVFPHAHIEQYPVADGGEGTVEAFVAATNGTLHHCRTHDALGREVEGFWGELPNGTAVIEMAAASGIELLTKEERNPLIASTFGTGEIILAALENGAKRIILGLGGSVTNDGGTGMAKALGYRFLDQNNNEIPEGGGALSQLEKIDNNQVNPLVKEANFLIACDVQNPLTGEFGASAVYGPQKGATSEMVTALDQNLAHFAQIVKRDLGNDIETVPGAGAAGGMGGGSIAFLNGTLMSGFDIVTQTLNLKEKAQKADIIVTGEGKIDAQTLQGKTPFAVAQLAKGTSKKVLAFAGYLGENHRVLYKHGFTAVFPIADKPMTLDESLNNASELLCNASERAFRIMQ